MNISSNYGYHVSLATVLCLVVLMSVFLEQLEQTLQTSL